MFNQKKRITIEFDASPKEYETSIANAKEALLKAKKANINKGTFEIDDVKIEIEELHGGMM